MLTGRLGAQLNSWMSAVSADGVPHLRRFVRGLETDHAADLNGLTLPYSSGAVEGHVNRIILWNLTTRTIMFSSGLTTELRRRYEWHGGDKWPVLGRHAQATDWLRLWTDLGRAPRTIDAYARGLADYLQMCEREGADPLTATRADIGIYVRELTERPSLRGLNIVSIDSGSGLANATTGQRLVSVRLFYDYLIKEGLRESNPVGRGRYTPGRCGSGHQRGLVPRLTKLPWIPTERQWADILEVAAAEPVRNFGDARSGLRRGAAP